MTRIINWDDVTESSFINEEGKYTLKVVEHKRTTTANGNECDVYTCQTKDGEKINVSLYLVDKAMWKYKKFAKACGLSVSGSTDLDELPKAFVGKKFVGLVKRQPDKLNVETGAPEKSKYFEVAEFYPVEA
jgi:hypothetical protein